MSSKGNVLFNASKSNDSLVTSMVFVNSLDKDSIVSSNCNVCTVIKYNRKSFKILSSSHQLLVWIAKLVMWLATVFADKLILEKNEQDGGFHFL